jgi:hypothetical protein
MRQPLLLLVVSYRYEQSEALEKNIEWNVGQRKFTWEVITKGDM